MAHMKTLWTHKLKVYHPSKIDHLIQVEGMHSYKCIVRSKLVNHVLQGVSCMDKTTRNAVYKAVRKYAILTYCIPGRHL